ncbi:diguanylate cyclase/phosphodiesterase with PAS/PAC sensor(s) [Psychromonas ingrahamii 37]|uniref:Diguanylate cyclase/phosphodiesterase with PAS/PAC sensor(S) n=1 Tax=Psychromonas ingrahamii (strain DSM 17664 / CCUG 51855 / 37) TaxID=357804 RepID=A1SWH2_PSYIN|nr:diguanylate cyclase [Psychromonas ingrahamii]ABM03837.1 diguanylate cyclase/phosphodiesterase with PAS/PAC sensor(s) [Psychromonas ingrahamii 37]
MSDPIKNLLYLGDNIALIDTLFNSFFTDEKTDNYHVFHLVSGVQLCLTLSENNFSHFISERPLNTDIKDKIKADFPLLKTTYLNADDEPKETKLSVDVENIFTDEVKALLESLSIPIYFKNKQAQYLACNHHFSKLLGLSPAQIIGKTFAELSDSPLKDEIEKIDPQMFTDHQVGLHEYRGTNKVGEKHDLLFYNEFTANGKMQSGLIFDITELNKSKYLLEKQRRILRATVDISPDMISYKDLKSRILGGNSPFEKFVGSLEKEVLGKTVYDFFPLEQAIASIKHDQKVIKNNKVNVQEVISTDDDGERHLLNMKKIPVQDKQGDVQGLISVGRNMTEQRKTQKRFEIADAVFENSKESLIVTDEDGRIISANDHACIVFGYSKEQLLAQEINILASETHDGAYYKNIEQLLEADGSWQGDITYRTKIGDVCHAWLEAYEVQHTQENRVERVYSYTDLTHFQVTDKKISFLSKQDPLTGLHNRISLFSRLEDRLTRANYQHSAVAVILVDIDDFKAINNKYGHNGGNQILKEVARRLKNCLYGKYTLGRFVKDQFIIIIDELASEHDAATVARQVTDQFSSAFIIENVHKNITASIGISLSPDDGIEVAPLFLNAEKAKRHSKNSKSTVYNFYTPGLTLGLNKEFELEKELKQALLSDQLDLYYQPQYDLSKRQIVALQGLLRWHHPKRGILLPEHFLSVAEGSHLLVPIGWKMIRKACLKAVSWENAQFKFGRIAIDLFKIQLSQISFIAELQTILKETGCSTGQLEFLVDKAILCDASADILSNLDNANKMGFTLTVTNFGMAEDVIDLIDRLGVANLKISDPQIKNASGSLANNAQLKSANVFASSLGINILSDTLDNAEQKEFSTFNRPDSGKAKVVVHKKVMSASEATFYLHCNKHR